MAAQSILGPGNTAALKSSVTSFIKEKQLDYFNFRLNGFSGGIRIEIEVALEEKEAWIDYSELIKKVIV